jgi:two-component system OmpR family sensor kinase
VRPTHPLRPLRRLLPRTLRARLTAGLLVLLALASAVIGLVTTSELQRFLVAQVDQQLTRSGGRYALSLEHPGQGDTRAQSVGTLGVRMKNGQITSAGVVDGDPDDRASGDPDDRPAFATRERAQFAALRVGGPPVAFHLDGLGTYQLVAQAGRDGDVLVTGLPLEPVESTVHKLLMVELVVFGVLFAVTAAAGTFWVRLTLRPLDRVARTAEQVSALPLASGEVALETRVPDQDPSTEVGRVGVALNLMLGHVEHALAQRHAVEGRLRAFAADASHELRTPLAAIRGHAELALRRSGQAPEPVRHSLRRIEAESLRMGAIVEDLLLLARLDAGRPPGRGPPAGLGRGRPLPTRARLRQRRPCRRARPHLAAGAARGAGPGHRRRGPSAPGRHQPAGQRPQPHPAGDPGDPRTAQRAPRGRPHRRRHRPWHPP